MKPAPRESDRSPAVHRRAVVGLATSALATSALAVAASTAAKAQLAMTSLDNDLRSFRQRFELPAVAAAVVKDGHIPAAGAVGTRRIGSDIAVTLEDRFHIGSNTKAMTATLAAMLVEEGWLRWETTVGETYPELAPRMAADVRRITLEQLLSHTSGIPGDRPGHAPLISFSVTDKPANLDEMRQILVSRLVGQPLRAKPGRHFEYSNLGYTLAGAMMERIAGATWEELIVTRLFEPLQLRTAGFGSQSSLGRVDAPLGHVRGEDGQVRAFLAGPWGDNPPIIGPAGTVHLSILDFATWAAWNTTEGRGSPPLVGSKTIRKLQTRVVDMPAKPDAPAGTPSSGGYGLGWGITTLPFARDPFVFHGGSNNLNLAYILLQPRDSFGLVLAANIGGPRTNDALMAIAAELYGRFAPLR